MKITKLHCRHEMISNIIISLVFFDQLARGAVDATESFGSNVSEGDTEELVSLAQHIREDPLIIEQFTPSVSKILELCSIMP